DSERDTRLAAAVRKFFAPPEASEHGSHGVGLGDYCEETIACDVSRATDFEYSGPFSARIVAPFWARWCSGFNRTIERLLRRKRATGSAPPEPPVTAMELPFGPDQAAPFVRLFLHFHRADVLANAYAEMYRSAHLLIATLGVAAVALGA